MRQIKTLLISLVLLLTVACTSTAIEPAAPAAAPVIDEAAPIEAEPAALPVETSPEEAMSETEGNELAAKPQFIMFTASW